TEHCRSVFTFDACHSKSSYKDVYLGANTIEGEGKLVLTLPTINTNENIIISDHEKGIANAVQTELPNVFHTHCVWHIEKNVNTKFRTKLGGKIWAIAKVLHVEDFENIIKDISKLYTEAAIYFNEILPETWTLTASICYQQMLKLNGISSRCINLEELVYSIDAEMYLSDDRTLPPAAIKQAGHL
ncbi:22766_t:CDS:2, partial [Gigaspora margarita]